MAKCGYKLAEIHLMQCYSGYKGVIKTYKEQSKNLFTEPRKSQFLQITEPALKALEKAANDEEAIARIKKSLQKELIDLFTKDQNIRYISCNVFPYFSDEGKMCFDYVLLLSINWEAQWQNYAIKLTTYQHQNIMLIDF